MALYLDIAQSGNLNLLTLKGYPTKDQLNDQWLTIISENNRANGNSDLDMYNKTLTTYARLMADYELVKLGLMTLLLVVDNPTIAYLKSKGFNIDTSSYSSYCDSIESCLTRSNNYLTKIKMKRNELFLFSKEDKQLNKTGSIQDALAAMSYVLGFPITLEVKLADFNAYKKLVHKKIQAGKYKSKAA